jgi:hypothetical protein
MIEGGGAVFGFWFWESFKKETTNDNGPTKAACCC